MQVRWGIIGCGDIARRRVAKAISDDPGSQLLAACRRDRDKLNEFCHEFHVPRAYESDEELIRDPDIDAVYVATPVDLHRMQTVSAARMGKHVLVEKPMAMSVAECDEMIAAGTRYEVKLSVAYYRRFYPVVERIRQFVASGEIGKPLSIRCATAAAFAMGPQDDGYWRVIPQQGGGGALMDIGSHRINLFLNLLGDIVEVKSMCDTVAANYQAEDCASLVMRFGNGMHGSLQCFFGCPIDLDELTMVGTKGQLKSDPLNSGQLFVEVAGESRVESHPPHANLHAPLIADFVAAIRDNRPPKVTGEEGRATNEVMQRAYENAV